ncbi:hypothetical protein DNTS_001754 [Danionella cerebrum]|uniref:Uncharacterized protein n=1 Tax=Danionella cerebrum TaxID=2873325 RepID=A0A553MRW6_9TELE|nr:hypothetical protein DNTS_001754 [Danionella translucida]
MMMTPALRCSCRGSSSCRCDDGREEDTGAGREQLGFREEQMKVMVFKTKSRNTFSSCAPQETPVLQPVLKISPREHPHSGVASLRRSLSIQSLVESVERPWAGVTLNRCLMLAVSLLLLSSALQRLHDAVRGRKEVSEELTSQRFALIRREKLPLQQVRSLLLSQERLLSLGLEKLQRSSSIGSRITLPLFQAESSLWSSLLCWINDEDDGRPENPERASRSLRHRALENPRLLKNRHSSFKQRRGRDDERMREKRGEEVLEKKKAAEERLRDDGRRREKEEDGVKTQRKRKGREVSVAPPELLVEPCSAEETLNGDVHTDVLQKVELLSSSEEEDSVLGSRSEISQKQQLSPQAPLLRPDQTRPDEKIEENRTITICDASIKPAEHSGATKPAPPRSSPGEPWKETRGNREGLL